MEKAKITPKDFFLWIGAMIALYASVFAFVALVFDYLDYLLPDKLAYYSGNPYSSGIANEMATLVVLFPLFLVLMRMIRRSIVEDSTRADVWVRRWALYLTLAVSIAAMAGGVIILLVNFFQGDVTLSFLLKVATVLIVAVIAFGTFRADLRGYWDTHPRHARIARWAAFVFMIITIVAGFFIVGTPWQARLYRFDDEKVNDLQSIQYQIVNYFQQKGSIPASINDLNDPLQGYTVPTDPQIGEDESGSYTYEYQVKGDLSFALCATFNASTTRPSARGIGPAPIPVAVPIGRGGKGVEFLENQPWTHTAGRVCFERTIDPDRYPPFPKTKQM